MKEDQITYKIRSAIYDVYNKLGPGLLESIYEEALIYELKKLSLQVVRQKEVPVMYDGIQLCNHLRLDILVENKVIVEIKSVADLKDVHYKQLTTYLKLSNLYVGILVNFNTNDILSSTKRVYNNRYKK